MPHLLNHQDRRMEKKIGFGTTVFSMYSGILPSKEEICICRDGVISREANIYSLPETLAGREPFLPSLPAAAHARSEAARLVQREARTACKARINHFRPGSTRRPSKLCTCMDEERPLQFCCRFPFSDLLLTAGEV